ncbi:MAG: hypothetical protein EOO06_19400 [Chitinophagaceae bacterium]|nr:MAG: hypothetical protein EOO06_19400 [Chitinophagaceae bacterium]
MNKYILTAICLFTQHLCIGQRFFIGHKPQNFCMPVGIRSFYSGVSNIIVLKSLDSSIDVSGYVLCSKDAFIGLSSSGVFNVRPKPNRNKVKLLFVEQASRKVIDSASIPVDSNFISVSIKEMTNEVSFPTLVRTMSKLKIFPLLQGCVSYTDEFKLVSAELIWERNSVALAIAQIDGDGRIPIEFRTKVKKGMRKGDNLSVKTFRVTHRGKKIDMKGHQLAYFADYE